MGEFQSDLYGRGLTGRGLEMICTDGGQGLLAALPVVWSKFPVQCRWAHKVRKVYQVALKKDLHRVMNADTLTRARSAARRFADR